MNNQEKYQDDPLRKYLSPERREETPEGFTSKVMTRVGLDSIPFVEVPQKRNLVPYIFALVTILLIAAAFLIPHSDTDLVSTTVMNIVNGIKFSVPDLSSIFKLSIPVVITYAFIGIFVLAVFDKALYRFFKKEK